MFQFFSSMKMAIRRFVEDNKYVIAVQAYVNSALLFPWISLFTPTTRTGSAISTNKADPTSVLVICVIFLVAAVYFDHKSKK